MSTHPPGYPPLSTHPVDWRVPGQIRCCQDQHAMLPHSWDACCVCDHPVEGWTYMDAASGRVGHPHCLGFYDHPHYVIHWRASARR